MTISTKGIQFIHLHANFPSKAGGGGGGGGGGGSSLKMAGGKKRKETGGKKGVGFWGWEIMLERVKIKSPHEIM